MPENNSDTKAGASGPEPDASFPEYDSDGPVSDLSEKLDIYDHDPHMLGYDAAPVAKPPVKPPVKPPRKHKKRAFGVLFAALTTALLGAVGFRIYLSVKDYLDYKEGFDVYSDFQTLDDSDFPDYDPAVTSADASADTSASTEPAENPSGPDTSAPAASDTGAETSSAQTTAQTSKTVTFEDFINQLKWLDSAYDDFYCWIKIKSTTINYPVVKGDDNEYYLNHDIYRNRLSLGSHFRRLPLLRAGYRPQRGFLRPPRRL